jgi:hypothetical protein
MSLFEFLTTATAESTSAIETLAAENATVSSFKTGEVTGGLGFKGGKRGVSFLQAVKDTATINRDKIFLAVALFKFCITKRFGLMMQT